MSRRSCVVVVELFACSRAELVPGTVLWLGVTLRRLSGTGEGSVPQCFCQGHAVPHVVC